jgi:hypothetical protein
MGTPTKTRFNSVWRLRLPAVTSGSAIVRLCALATEDESRLGPPAKCERFETSEILSLYTRKESGR